MEQEPENTHNPSPDPPKIEEFPQTNKDSSTIKDLKSLQDLIKTLNQNHGNVLHLCVYTRNFTLFNSLKTPELLSEKHKDLTPIELAQKLGFIEFYTQTTILKEHYFEKYLNPLSGYQKRHIKMDAKNLICLSKKSTTFDIEKCTFTKKLNKLKICQGEKTLKLKGDLKIVDEWYELLTDKEKRLNFKGEDVDLNIFYYVFIGKILSEKLISDKIDNKFCDVLREISPFDEYLSFRDEDSSDTYYSSCEEEFYDVKNL